MGDDEDDLSVPFQQQKKRIPKPPPKKADNNFISVSEPALVPQLKQEVVISNNDPIVPMEVEKPSNLDQSLTTTEKALEKKKKLLSKPSVDKDLPSFSKKKKLLQPQNQAKPMEKNVLNQSLQNQLLPRLKKLKKKKWRNPLKR